jgi:hypothetical protein
MATFSHRADITPAVPPLDRSPSGRLPHVVATAEPRPAGRPLYRDPTGNRAVGRTPDDPVPAAPVTELRSRLCRAVQAADGHGIRLIAAHLQRAVG